MKIAGIILAAGLSARMGATNKLLMKFKDHTIIEEVIMQLSNSQVDDIIVITGHEHRHIESVMAAKPFDKIKIIFNANYEKGRLESVKKAIKEVYHHSDAALFMVGDKPGVKTTLIDKAISNFKKEVPAILSVQTPVGRGHPIIFSNRLFDELLGLKEDQALDKLISQYSDNLVLLKDNTVQINVNTEDDYHRLINSLEEN